MEIRDRVWGILESILKSFGDIPKFIAKGYYRNDAFYSAVYEV